MNKSCAPHNDGLLLPFDHDLNAFQLGQLIYRVNTAYIASDSDKKYCQCNHGKSKTIITDLYTVWSSRNVFPAFRVASSYGIATDGMTVTDLQKPVASTPCDNIV